MSAFDVTIGGTAAGAANTITGAVSNGIVLYGSSVTATTGDLIAGNLIGVKAITNPPVSGHGNANYGITAKYTTGLAVLGNTIEENGNEAIRIYNSTAVTIGGTAAGAANLIAKDLYGLDLEVDQGVSVTGNTIKTNVDTGVYAYSLSGSSASFKSNTVSSNGYRGVYIHASTLHITLQGNTIDDNDVVGSTHAGLTMKSISGSSVKILNNTISGNTGTGIYIPSGTASVDVAGNVITGTLDGSGIYFEHLSHVTIGGTTAGMPTRFQTTLKSACISTKPKTSPYREIQSIPTAAGSSAMTDPLPA